MDSLREYLSQPRIVELQILLYLYGSRILAPVTEFYNKIYKQLSCVEAKPASFTHGQSQSNVSSSDFTPFSWKQSISYRSGSRNEWFSREEGLVSHHRSIYQKPLTASYMRPIRFANGGAESLSDDSFKSREEPPKLRPDNVSQHHDYKWIGVPKFYLSLKWYGVFSTTYMAYVMIRNVLPLEEIIEYVIEPGLPARCYLVGRVAPKLSVSGHVTMICAASHLVWRLGQYLTKYHNLPVCMFLIQNDHDVASYTNHLNVRKSIKAHGLPDEGVERPVERLFRTIIAYPIYHGLHKEYHVRMNRTPEAREKLRNRMVNSFMMGLFIHAWCFLVIGSAVILDLITDKAYVRAYPNCSPEIDELVDSGKVGYFSVTMTWHKLISSLWDLVESFIIWFDSAVAVFYVVPLGYLEDFDLYLYWTSLEEKLRNLFLQMKIRNDLELAHSNIMFDPRHELRIARDIKISMNEQLELVNYIELYQRQDHETQVNELQAELADFFHQLKIADRFISDSITMGIIVWPVGFCMYSYVTTTDQSISNMGTKAVLGFTMGLVSYSSIRFCSLSRRVARSYRMLCSIMAHDNSKYKRKFLPVLDFYSLRKYTYTILREHPYSFISFLTVMGWTFSCMARQMNEVRPLVSYLGDVY